MATATRLKTFRSQREGDIEAQIGQDVRDCQWALFGMYSREGFDVEDFDLLVDRIQAATAWQRGFVKGGILGYARLQDLPRLREIQEQTRLLDVTHLRAINSALEELGPDVEPSTFELFDDLLADLFCPKRDNQQFPSLHKITAKIRELIKRVDPSRAYDQKKRKQRDTGDNLAFDEFLAGGVVRSRVELSTNAIVAKRVHGSIKATAREHGLSMFDAAVQLLTGEIVPTAAMTLNVYAPKDRAEGDAVYIPGHGWTDPEGTAAFEEWLANVEPKVVDLDETAQHTTSSYAPTEAIRAAIVARDGTCIYPGCRVPAERCQLDHRIPFEQGGATTASNLHCLCQKHHNLKTDRRGFYFPDPTTGDIVWCFSDGTYEIESPSGLIQDQITPAAPRWRSSLENVRKNRALHAEFNAKCHKILDEFEKDQDLARATSRLEELEEKYGLTFEHRPQPTWAEPLPEEPTEPAYPEESPPEENPFHERSFRPASFVEWSLARAKCAHIMSMVEEAS